MTEITHRCTAHSSRTGERCKLAAIRGGNVCGSHGGRAPQVKKKAQERINDLVDPALNELARLIDSADSDSVKLQAVKDVLDRAGHKSPEKIDVGLGSLLDIIRAEAKEISNV